MRTRIRCHVIETPVDRDFSRRGARELLPWADPYIAGLMRRLERGHSEENREERMALSNPFAVSETAAEDDFGDEWQQEEWQQDAFMPRPIEESRFHCHPPVIGGFPLLDDE